MREGILLYNDIFSFCLEQEALAASALEDDLEDRAAASAEPAEVPLRFIACMSAATAFCVGLRQAVGLPAKSLQHVSCTPPELGEYACTWLLAHAHESSMRVSGPSLTMEAL